MAYALVDETEDHFKVRDDESGKEHTIAKDGLPLNWHMQLKKMPKVEPVNMADGGEFEPDQMPEPQPEPTPMPPGQGWEDVGQPPRPEGYVAPGTPAEPAQFQAVAPPVIPEDFANEYKKAFATQQGALSKIGQIESAGALAREQAYKAQTDQMADAFKHYTDSMAEQKARIDEIQKDVINNKIDPHHFWNQYSGVEGGARKALALIGMVLGGPMQLRTGVNPAGQIIQNAINADLDAQRENLGTKKTILSQEYAKYGNINLAYQAANLHMTNMFQAQLNQIANSTQSQLVKQQAMLASSQLEPSKIKLLQDLSMSRSIMNTLGQMGPGGPADVNTEMLPKEIRERVIRVPQEFGGGHVLTRSNEDAAKLSEAQESYQALQDTIAAMKLHMQGGPTGKAGIRSPFSSLPLPRLSTTSEEGGNLQKQAQGQLRELLGKLRPQMGADTILGMVPDVSIVNQDKAKAGVNQLESYANSIMKSAYSTRTQSNLRQKERPISYADIK